jgi:tetratricopeptide (TPR) repeat protein
MASRRQLGSAGAASAAQLIFIFAIALILLARLSAPALAQTRIQNEHVVDIEKLFDQKRWEDVVREVEAHSERNAEIDYRYGLALAQLGRLKESRSALAEGWLLAPADARFPVELAGVAFIQKRYSDAVRLLRLGLRLDPDNPYADDFLATVYFLQGNIEASLKYWNRIDKPFIENVRVSQKLQVDPVLLDRAFTFAPARTMSLRDFLTSRKRVEGLGIYPVHHLRLDARDDGRFDVQFNAQEKNGWGGWLEGSFSTFRSIFDQTIYLDYYNIRGSATNVKSLLRWDARKRRIQASLSSPWEEDPKYRYRTGFDARSEDWALWKLHGAAEREIPTLSLIKEAVDAEFTCFNDGPWNWSLGAEISHRSYRNIRAASSLPPMLLKEGFQLKQLSRLDYELARVPEERFESRVSLASEIATLWASPAQTFFKLQGSVDAQWHPRMRGDDYAVLGRIRLGRTVGSAPFDELFMLGLENDNALWMRAQSGTRDGRKGNAPMGRFYFLLNFDVNKNIMNRGYFDLKLSPFLDVGRITDPLPVLGSREWLWNTGLQAKIRLFGVSFLFIYGKDLRSGANSFDVSAGL